MVATTFQSLDLTRRSDRDCRTDSLIRKYSLSIAISIKKQLQRPDTAIISHALHKIST